MLWVLDLVLLLDPLNVMDADQLCCLLERGGKGISLALG